MQKEFFREWRPNMELEAGIKNGTNVISFNHALSAMLYVNNNNMVQHEEFIDIIFHDGTRVTIEGVDNISRYCKTGKIYDVPYKCIKKTKLRIQDLEDMNVRLRLSTEEQSDIPQQNPREFLVYRLKKRVSVKSLDGLYSYDFTIVKQTTGNTFATSRPNMERREIEMEYIGSVPPVEEDFQSRLDTLLAAYYQDPLLTPLSLKLSALTEYIDLCQRLKFIKADSKDLLDHIKNVYRNTNVSGFSKIKQYNIGPKPITLEKTQLSINNTPNIFSNYLVTIKADGDRVIVFVDSQNRVFLIDGNMNVKRAGSSASFPASSIFDGELVHTNNNELNVLFFDCFVVKGKDVSQEKLLERMQYIPDELKTKKYKFSKKTFEDIANVKKVLSKNYGYETDGVIYTPTGPGKVIGTWEECFKWKPAKQNTIDFIVSFVKDANNNRVEVFEKGQSYNILNVYVGSAPVSPSTYFQANGKKYIAVPFVTSGSKVHQIKLESGKKCENGDTIQDNFVVECYYDNDHWIPYRVRYDKTWDALLNKTITGNNIKSAHNVWKSIMDPIEPNDLLVPRDHEDQGDIIDAKYYERKGDRKKMHMHTMNKLHNMVVKNKFTFEMLARNKCKSILDVACGKGGDLHKWIDNNFTTVLGIDIFEDNIVNPIDGAYKRLSESKVNPRNKYVFVPMDSSKPYGTNEQIRSINDPYTAELVKCVWGKSNGPKELQHLHNMVKDKFDVASCQFAIHYFFESEEKLDNLLTNITKNLKRGGYFVGTTFDGDSVIDMLEARDGKAEGKTKDTIIWSIEREKKLKRGAFGQKISVFVESINKTHDEFIVPYDLLVKKAEQHGLRELTSEEAKAMGLSKSTYMFGEIFQDMETNMGALSEQFSFLNRWFIFKYGSLSQRSVM